jgi:hypothetical protein
MRSLSVFDSTHACPGAKRAITNDIQSYFREAQRQQCYNRKNLSPRHETARFTRGRKAE